MTQKGNNDFYNKCMYDKCTNGKHNGYRLFRFPDVKDVRHEFWMDSCGNSALRKWAPSSIRKAGLCRDHFSDEAFTCPMKVRLRKGVNPLPRNDNLNEESVTQYIDSTDKSVHIMEEVEITH